MAEKSVERNAGNVGVPLWGQPPSAVLRATLDIFQSLQTAGLLSAFDYPLHSGENECGNSSTPFVSVRGPVAQLGARFHGMEEVVGSIPTRSTKLLNGLARIAILIPKF